MSPNTNSTPNETPRFVGTNWEPEVRATNHGQTRPDLKRKVMTTGTITLECGALITLITRLLRKGKEVRLGNAVRIFPIMLTDMKTMSVSAQAMEGITKVLADKKAKVLSRGKEVDGVKIAKAAAKRHQDYVEITPDTVITCNVCGNKIRVGRALANA